VISDGLPIHVFARICAARTGQICLKFDIWVFKNKICREISNLFQTEGKVTGTLLEDLGTFSFPSDIKLP
jgi:hypothetical protein